MQYITFAPTPIATCATKNGIHFVRPEPKCFIDKGEWSYTSKGKKPQLEISQFNSLANHLPDVNRPFMSSNLQLSFYSKSNHIFKWMSRKGFTRWFFFYDFVNIAVFRFNVIFFFKCSKLSKNENLLHFVINKSNNEFEFN